MHAGMVQMGTEKMSKSLGNIELAGEVAAHFGGERTRYWALSGSYRSQVAFTHEALDDAGQGYERLRTFLFAVRHALGPDMPDGPTVSRRPVDTDVEPKHVRRFVEAMDDDLNSPEAFAALHDLVREANRLLEPAQRGDADARRAVAELTDQFLELTQLLGLSFDSAADSAELSGRLIDYLLELREQARGEKAFERADQIRSRLTELGVTVEDTPAGPRWRVGGD